MYIYSLTEPDNVSILLNDKEFSEEEFASMCKEAPIFNGCGQKSYDVSRIVYYLITTYDFIDPEYTAEFDADNRVE